MRTGLIAKKAGMTRYFNVEDGTQVPVTVLKIENCQVTALRTEDKDGYSAVQLGAGNAKVKRVSNANRGHFAKAKVEPKQKVAEFRIDAENAVDLGAELGANHFVAGQFIDVQSTSKGKGFAGAMKRHNFGGTRATHGVSVAHRALGSTGQCQDPGKVFKGKKMAGHYGDETVTVQNLRVVAIDEEENVILVKGAVPGGKNGWVLISDAVKKKAPEGVPMPAGLRTVPAPAEEQNDQVAEIDPDQAQEIEGGTQADEVNEEGSMKAGSADTTEPEETAPVDETESSEDNTEEKKD